MKATLQRADLSYDGIFGFFTFAGDYSPFMDTLEHAYAQPDGSYAPKVAAGTYTCVRGMHVLHNGVPFETFEITGVTGHKGILFHPGNFNRDSEGCVLCGQGKVTQANGEEMLTGSKVEFAAFMKRLLGADSFTLEVV